MLDFLSRLLGKENASSKNVAKERLRFVLVHDRASISPNMLNQMREDIIKVISRYMDVDTEALDIQITQTETEAGGGNGPALYANIPIKEVRFHR